MASRGRNVLLRLTGDSGDAKRAVNEVRSDLRRMSREESKIRLDIQTARVERSIKAVEARLAGFRAQAAKGIDVDVKTKRAEEQLALLSLRADRLSLKKVNIDVDVRRGALERTAAGLGTVERGIAGVATGFGDAFRAIPVFGQVFATVLNGAISLASTLGSALGSLVTAGIESLANTFKSLGNLGALAGPIGAVVASLVGIGAQFALIAALGGAVAIALNAVLGAVVALAGALVALVASLTAAIAGFAALATAFGGILLPIVVVAIGLFSRFAAILKARQAQEQALATATQDQKTAEQQRKDALDASRQAHERLREATVEGNRAMAQSVTDLRDAQLGLESTQLGVKEARLNLKEAQQALKEFRQVKGIGNANLNGLFKRATDVTADPKQQRAAIGDLTSATKGKADPLELQRRILAVQRAQLGVKESINATTKAEDALAEATKKRADFVKRGIEAYKPYRTALDQVHRAEIRLARAQEQTTAAQRKYERALKGLSNTERGSLSRVNSLITGFKNLAKAFTDPIFKALNETFDSLKGSGKGFKDALTEVGKAFGDFVRSIGAFLREPRTQSAFSTMARGAATLTRELGSKAFVDFLRIMREVAVSALPAVLRMARDVAGALSNVASQPGRIHSAVGTVVTQFRVWLRLAGSLIGLIKDIFVPASVSGASLANSMRHVVDRWREWIRENPEKVREFFHDAITKARAIFNKIRDIAAWLRDDLPAAAAKAKQGFKDIYTWVKKVYDLVKKVVDLAKGKIKVFGKEINLPGPADVPVSPLNEIRKRSDGPNKLEKAIGGVLKKKHERDLGDHRSPDAGRGRTASTSSVINNIFNIPAPLAAGASIDPENAAALLSQAWERRGGGLS